MKHLSLLLLFIVGSKATAAPECYSYLIDSRLTNIKTKSIHKNQIEENKDLIETYVNRGEKESALTLLQKILVLIPHDDWAWNLYADLNSDLGHILVAKHAQARAHLLNPKLKFQNFDRTTVHTLLRQGHYTTAREYFPAIRAIAAKTHPLISLDLKKYHMADAKYRYDEEQYTRALRSLDFILNNDPNDYIALSLYSKIKLNMGYVIEALSAQEQVLMLEEEFRVKSYISYAQILLFAKAYEASEKYIQLALQNTNDKWEKSFALGILSQVYLHSGDYENALITMHEKASIDEDHHTYAILDVEYHYRKNKLKKALELTNEILETRDPKSQSSTHKIYRKTLIYRALILAKMNYNLDQALQDIDKFVKYLNFKPVWSLILKAEIKFKLFKYQESKELLLQAVSNSKKMDLNLIAALRYVDKMHRKQSNLNEEDKQVVMILSLLTDEEKDKLKDIENSTNWDDGFLKFSSLYGESIADKLWIDLDALAVRVFK